jgi:hypothetical protein
MGGVDAVLSFSPSMKQNSQAVEGLRPGGRLVTTAVSAEPIQGDPVQMLFKQTSIIGSAHNDPADLDCRSLNIDTFNLIYVLMGHALPEEAPARPVQRGGDAQTGVHPQVSNRGETAHSSGGVSFGFAIGAE